MHNKFAEMAKHELEEALSVLPSDTMQRFVLFSETLRVLDYWTVFQPLLPKEKRLSQSDFDLIQWGWNLALEHLFTAVKEPGVFPISKSTTESRSFATRFLHKLGQSVLLRRASEMIRYGYLSVECNADNFTVRSTENTSVQFLDQLEFYHLKEMKKKLNHKETGFSNGWKLSDINDYPKLQVTPGSYFGRETESPFEHWKVKNVNELMKPLIHPWDSGHGIMMGYEAHPDVDNHFFAEATELSIEWRDEAGIHPDAKLDKISGADLTAIIAFMASLHAKHVRFALLAMKNYPEISIPQSLTVWCPLKELVESISAYSNINKALHHFLWVDL